MAHLTTITFWSRDGEEEFTRNVPFKWEICANCEGCATDRGASVECDGGGFTSSEWAEQDDDFKQDYLSGAYDRPCLTCKGLGRVQIPDIKLLPADEQELYYADREADADFAAMSAAERRMGA